ncbi:MAG: hypothetical protein K2O70_06365 [Desulfovibrionaceae bacterium]|nr:hypothetical protein [Desulfovibrionaceae bacterium]
MCYTGSCLYEDCFGECTLGYRRVYPTDAACSLHEDAPPPETEHEDGPHEE